MKLIVVTAANDGAIEHAFASFVEQRADILLVGSDPFFNSRRDRIVALAVHHNLPAMSLWAEFAAAGGLAKLRAGASPTRTAKPASMSHVFSRARSLVGSSSRN